ncbi:MAG: DNA recombination protein RmuC [Salinivirgaceae bacterium]|nr:DNA recombination protein RmuC [Salinivirgaceae bacterium]
MDWIIFMFGVILGAFVVWLLMKRQQNTLKNFVLSSKNLEEELQNIKNQNEVKEDRINLFSSQIIELKQELFNERNKSEKLSTALAISQTEQTNLTEKLSLQKADLLNLQKHFSDQFNNLANKILEEKTEKFTHQNKEQLGVLLNPLNEKLKAFEQKIDDTYIKNVKDRTDLQAEIKKLYDLNSKISEEANNLTKALKGDVKKQGSWGELILEKILETSGLQKDREFKTQVALTSPDGKKYQPDVIIYLPENKHIIIDSKVSLIAYDQFINSESKEEQNKFIKEHLISLKNHIKQLADKQYYSLNELNSPEYVLMFVPIEASFSLAISEDHNLFNFAWEHKIVIVSPSTLIATLLTVSSIWRQENQTKNAIEIAKKSGDLYDKFVGLTESLTDLGQKLKQTQAAYDSSINKLSEGKGNLIKRAEDIRKLGAKTSKSISQHLIDEIEE